MVVNWGRFVVEPDDDQLPGSGDGVVGRFPDGGHAGRLEDQRVGVPVVVLGRPGPELQGQLQPAGVRLHHVRLGAGGQQRLADELPLRSGPDHQAAGAHRHVRPADGGVGDHQRLAAGQGGVGPVAGDRPGVLGRHGHPLGQDPAAGDGQDLAVGAGRGVPGKAGRAGAVGEVGLDHDPLADLSVVDSRPHGDDVAAALVPEHPRQARHLPGAVEDRQVRAAEPDPADLDDHVARTGLGLGPVVDDLHPPRRHQRDRSHAPSLRDGHNFWSWVTSRPTAKKP
jgi:hypothetical protein